MDRLKPWPRIALLFAGIWIGGAAASFAQSLPVITSVRRFYSMSIEEARRSYPLEIEGIVTYADAQWRLLWMQDETGALFVNLPEGGQEPASGTRVRMQARTGVIGGELKVLEPSFTLLGDGELPSPVLLMPEDIEAGRVPAHWVEFTGVVYAMDTDTGRLRLDVLAGKRLHVLVTIRDYDLRQRKGLVDAFVKIAGVCATNTERDGHFAPLTLFSPRLADVVVFEPAPADPFSVRGVEIEAIADRFAEEQNVHRLKVHGKVLSQDFGRSLRVEDPTGAITVMSTLQTRTRPGDVVEVVGFPQLDSGGEYTLERSVFRVVEAADVSETVEPTALPLLHEVQAIRALTPEEAASEYPVEVEGTVTYYDRRWRVLFFQDSTGGVYVDSKAEAFELAPGDQVTIRGWTNPGGYAPFITLSQLVVSGTGQLPEARTSSLAQMLTGAEDSQWVSLTGVVRRVERIDWNVQLELARHGGRFTAIIAGWGDRPPPEHWVGARVRLRAVCGIRANARRQLLGLHLHVPGEEFVEFISTPPADPFAVQETPIAKLLQFSPTRTPMQRVKVSGTVTYRDSDGLVALQSGSDGILVQLPPEDLPGLADRVDVLGFPSVGAFSPTLENPLWRKIGEGEIPTATNVIAAELLAGLHDGRRVTIEARLLENMTASARPIMTLQSRDTVFYATLDEEGAEHVADVQLGSELRISGVCQVHADAWREPKAFGLLVSQPQRDIVVISRPPWLQLGHVLAASGVLTVVVLAALGWVVALKSQVALQTRRIQEHYERQTRLEQRYQDLFENAGDVIFTLDAEGRFASLNRAAERAFGSDRKALLHSPLRDRVDVKDRPRVQAMWQRLAHHDSTAAVEFTVHDQQGRNVVLETRTRVIHRDGTPCGSQCIARDITERRQLEVQLRHMQRMDSIGQLAAGLAHDFNNLLTAIHVHTHLLLENADSRPTSESLKAIEDAAARAADLTRHLLTFSRRQSMSVQKYDINQVVAELADMLSGLLGDAITLDCEFDATPCCIQADLALLEQVVINLVVNARDAMPEGGRLHIATSLVEVDDAHLKRNSQARRGTFVRLSVRDDGTGIEAAVLERIFEPFFTTKEVGKGTGLGLATVFGIVKQHEGWIEVASQLGQGTTFCIYFPLCEEGQAPSKGQPQPPRGSHETIRVADDETPVRELFETALEQRG